MINIGSLLLLIVCLSLGGYGFKPHQHHCVVSLSKTHQSFLNACSTLEDLSPHKWKTCWLGHEHNCLPTCKAVLPSQFFYTGTRSAVGNVSWLQIHIWLQVHACLIPTPVPYFHGDWSWNNNYGHYPTRKVVSYKLKYVHEVLVNRLVKLAQEKHAVKWTDHLDMTIAVDWDVKNQTKNNFSIPPISLEPCMAGSWNFICWYPIKIADLQRNVM